MEIISKQQTIHRLSGAGTTLETVLKLKRSRQCANCYVATTLTAMEQLNSCLIWGVEWIECHLYNLQIRKPLSLRWCLVRPTLD